HARKNGLLKVLSEKGTIVLSPQTSAALLSDLTSGDIQRLEQWKHYLSCSAFQTNLNLESATIRDVVALYTLKEKPGRSNYFNLLVTSLKQKQRESALAGHVLAEYL